MANPLELIGVVGRKGAKLLGIGERGLKTSDQTFLKYIEKSGQANRFKIVSTSGSRAERKAADRVLQSNGVVQRGTGKAKTVVRDTKYSENITLREAARRSHDGYVAARDAEKAKAVEAARHGKNPRFSKSTTINGRKYYLDAAHDNAFIPVREAYQRVHPRGYTALRHELRLMFGDSAFGRFMSNFFERMLNISSPAFRQPLRPVFNTTERAARKAAAQAQKEERYWNRLSDAAGRRTAAMESGAIKPRSVSATTIRNSAEEARREAVRLKDAVLKDTRGASRFHYEKSSGTFIDKTTTQRYTPQQAYDWVKAEHGKEWTTRWMDWFKQNEGFKSGRFQENVASSFKSTAAKNARARGKVIYDSQTHRFLTPREASRVFYRERAAANGVKAGENAVQGAAKGAKETYGVDEKLFNKMNAAQKERLRVLTEERKGYATQQAGIDELRNAAHGMNEAKQAGERARLLNEAAKQQAELNKQMAQNKNAMEALFNEANRSATSRLASKLSQMGPRKVAGWGGLLLGSGIIGYSRVSGKGIIPTLSPWVFGDHGVKGALGVAYNNDPDAIDNGIDQAKQTAQQGATAVGNKVSELTQDGRNAVSGLSEDVQEKYRQWQEEQRILAESRQGQSVPEYAANGFVDTGSGYYADPTQPQITTASQFSTSNSNSPVSQVNNLLSNAAGYVSGGNVQMSDIAKIGLGLYLTLGRFGIPAKVCGMLLQGLALHNVNTRGLIQQQPQQQSQQQTYDPRQAYQQELLRQQQNEPVEHVSRTV